MANSIKWHQMNGQKVRYRHAKSNVCLPPPVSTGQNLHTLEESCSHTE